ncbi:MAG: riboflavin synthase [Actinobacteria bacterium]|nr:riboflavin synthase [Actinomycetota bacterium]
MFTGIVEELGSVRSMTVNGSSARLEIECKTVIEDARIGDSISVNGCCLTVVDLDAGSWAADVHPETLDRTNLGGVQPGDPVNLERPVRLEDRLGGHLVQGHVDAVGSVTARDMDPDGSTVMTIAAPSAITRYVVEKGSITVDGVSLTVARVDDGGFAVALIPHTLAVTTLGSRELGESVNLEVDVVAKYVERLMNGHIRPDSERLGNS